MASAQRLVQESGSAQGHIIFLPMTARCGSTLMCSMFNKTGCSVAYSEPGVLSDLVRMFGTRKDSKAAEVVKTTLAVLCKPDSRQGLKHLIKMQPHETLLLPLLTRLYPSASFLFLYRNICDVVSSLLRIGVKSPLSIAYVLISIFNKNAAMRYMEYHMFDRYQFIYGRVKPTSRKATAPDSSTAEFHLGAVRSYFDIYNDDPKRIAAIRYDDMVQQPELFLKTVFEYCHLSTELVPKALKALEVDSQERSYVNKAGLSGFAFPPVPSDVGREEIHFLCDLLEIPQMLEEENSILPGTMIFQE